MSEIKRVSVSDVLFARDERVKRQQRLLAKYNLPLVSFTMNIAGDVKVNAGIIRAFREGEKRIESALSFLHAQVAECAETIAFTGCEKIWAVRCDARQLKVLLREAEDADELGRLFDMDVVDTDGTALKRSGERPCLICAKPVRACARARTHTAAELFGRTMQIIDTYFADAFVKRVAACAHRALHDEALTTPKPGLVDRENSGAHRDMTLEHFLKSADVLQPYFAACVRLGQQHAGAKVLQKRGKQAEEEMLRAVGVNTHKGAIFSLGILCYAAGSAGEVADMDAVLFTAAELGKHYLSQLQTENPMQTGGEKQYAAHGLTGARGEAASGFLTVKNVALPAFYQALEEGKDRNDAGLSALMHLIKVVMDSNVLRRGGTEGLCFVHKAAGECIQNGMRHDALRRMNNELVKRNLSPGGSADLLAVTYFLHDLYLDQ